MGDFFRELFFKMNFKIGDELVVGIVGGSRMKFIGES